MAGSLTVLSDAAHLLADLASFIVALAASHYASKPASETYTFGKCGREIDLTNSPGYISNDLDYVQALNELRHLRPCLVFHLWRYCRFYWP